MPPGESQPSKPESAQRRLPSVHALVERVTSGGVDGIPRSLVVEAARLVLDEQRSRLAAGAGDATDIGALAGQVEQRLARRPRLTPVINATGILIHTGLGRAPLAETAAAAACEAARHYVPVELDMETGGRGHRADLVRQSLCALTGAESATVVNNNAAALVIVLATMARGRCVAVSRGELVEIGGSFRLPDIMTAAEVVLREVGTTNRTRIGDYEQVIDDHVAAFMKVHPSNYRQTGFVESVPIGSLVELGRRHGIAVIDDIGSGALRATEAYGWPSSEPNASASIAAGADVVLFSGDKLLGGPQVGIIIGTASWIERIERHPLMRAMRVDKIRLAALAETLDLHRTPSDAARELPLLAMLTRPIDEVRRQAEQVAARLREVAGLERVEATPTSAYLGGGAVPDEAVPSVAVVLRTSARSEQEVSDRLRRGAPPVIARVSDGAVWLDMRTVHPDEVDALVTAIESSLAE